jgi:hypothetical protein
MLFEDGYNYTLLDQVGYDMCYLEAKQNNVCARRYIKIYYKNGNEIENKEIHDLKDLKKYNNIINKYYIEELDMTGSTHNLEYVTSKYYDVIGIGCFQKWICEFESNEKYEVAQNDKIKKIIEKYDSEFKGNINDEEFFDN